MFGLSAYKDDKGKEAEISSNNIIYQYRLRITVLQRLQNELKNLEHNDPQFEKKTEIYEEMIRDQLKEIRSFRKDYPNVTHECVRLPISLLEKKHLESQLLTAIKQAACYRLLLKENKELEAKELTYWDPGTKVINHPDDIDSLLPILAAKELNSKKRSQIDKEIPYFPIESYAKLLEINDRVSKKEADTILSIDEAYLEIAALSTLYSTHGLRTLSNFSRLNRILQQQKSQIGEPTLYISIMGNPQSGKSSLINQLTGVCSQQERSLPNVSLSIQENALQFSPSHNPGLPRFISPDVIIVCIDATQLDQLSDLHGDIKAAWSSSTNKNIILAVNKCDLLSEEQLLAFRENLLSQLGHHKNPYPIVEISAEIGINCDLLTAMAKLEPLTSGGSRYNNSPFEELIQSFSSLWARPDHPPSTLPGLAGYQSYQILNAEIKRHKSPEKPDSASSSSGNASTSDGEWAIVSF
ncbi:MAG: Ferrous iron transport protein [Gammaproteobacteria bacterium]|jgi:GTPase SAR1 family protein|nr:Ferrous iron transport protein [Gammaproteobacteria bacterium]